MYKNKAGLDALAETKVRSSSYEHAYNSMFFGWGSFINNMHHPRGRVWVVWRPQFFHVDIITSTAQAVHCKVRKIGSPQILYFTFVYGYNQEEQRQDLWV